MDLFVYGTLLFPELMEALTGRSFAALDAVLRDFERFQVQHEPYPAIIDRDGASVSGKVYFAIDEVSAELLERYEGDEFERCLVEVVLAGGTQREVHTYAVSRSRAGIISSEPWSEQTFAAENLDRYLCRCKHFRRGQIDALQKTDRAMRK